MASFGWWTQTQASYQTDIFDFVANVEENGDLKEKAYLDSDGIPTIGVGFNLRVSSVFDEVIERIFYPSGVPPSPITADQQYINNISSLVSQTWSNNSSLQSALDGVMAQRAADPLVNYANKRSTFEYFSDAEIKSTFDDLSPSYESILTSKVPSAPTASEERVALFSLTWNSPSLIGPGLQGAIAAGDRAEAWYEIRFNSNGDQLNGIAKRRYYESEQFGLYNPGVFDEAEARQVMQMFTRHFLQIENYEATYGSNVAAAETDYGVQISTTEEALDPAKIWLIVGYAPDGDIDLVLVDYPTSIGGTQQSNNLDFRFEAGGQNIRSENMLILGDAGNDIIRSGSGDDFLYGEEDDDSLYGYDGDDWLFGGSGNNTLNGGLGFEVIEYNYVFDDNSINILVAANTKANGDYDVTRTSGTNIETDTLQRIERVAHIEKQIEHEANGGTLGSNARNLNIAEIDLGYVAVFILDQANGLTHGVHYQLYDFNGQPIGETERVSEIVPYKKKEYNPDVTTTANGFVVVWDSEEFRHAGRKTLARAFSVDGQGNVTEEPQETVFVNTKDAQNEFIQGWKTADYDQTVDTLANGKVVVVAEAQGNVLDNPGISLTGRDILVNVLDGATADPQGTKTVVNTTQTADQTDPSVAALSNGEFVVAWTSSDGNGTGVFFQRMSESSGAFALQGVETQANVNTTGGQLSSSIVGLVGGGFVITWVDQSSNGSDVFFSLYNNSGGLVNFLDENNNPIGPVQEIRVNDQTNNAQNLPSVTALEDGGFVIAFTEGDSTGDSDGKSVYAQQYDSGGDRKGDNFLVNVSHEGAQDNSTVEGLGNGDFVVGWHDASHDLLNRVYSVSDSELVA